MSTPQGPRVLLVGQGPPATGGIPTFVRTLLDDPDLVRVARLRFLNTTHAAARPGAATLDNARWALGDLVAVARGARRADVVHLHLAPAPLLPLVRACALLAAAKLGGARTLLHAHSGRMHRVAEGSPAYRLGFWILARLADRVAVVSEEGAATVAAAGGRPERVVNAVDVDAFPPPARSPGRASIVFVGTVCERKGLEDLRRALETLRGRGTLARTAATVTIVGDGRQEGPGVFERVRDAYAASGLDDVVAFTGALSADQVHARLAAADIFCLPSHWEGMPLSLLEAMAAGAAVVATEVGDVPEALDHGGAGLLVPPHRPDALAEALGRLLDDPDLRTRLQTAARERAQARYDRTAMAATLLRIYRELAPGPYSM